jgi:hypothetical protein
MFTAVFGHFAWGPGGLLVAIRFFTREPRRG